MGMAVVVIGGIVQTHRFCEPGSSGVTQQLVPAHSTVATINQLLAKLKLPTAAGSSNTSSAPLAQLIKPRCCVVSPRGFLLLPSLLLLFLPLLKRTVVLMTLV